MAQKFRGVTKQQEFRPSDTVRDLRPLWQQIHDLFLGRAGSTVLVALLTAVILLVPMVADVAFFFVLLLFWYSFFTEKVLPFRMPMFSNRLDKNDTKPGSKEPKKAEGIYFFGNDMVTREQLWLSNTDMRTHVLIFGSTGSGKTETLLSLAYNALTQGSGFIYVDGKGDNSLFAKVFSMVRMMGREDDILVVNFMTGAEDIIGPQKKMLSNTLNPFALGSSSMLSNLIVSLMDSSGGGSSGSDGDMWKGRAIAFVQALMRPLVWLRDHGYLLLEASLIRRYFSLDILEDMIFNRKVVDQNNNVKNLDQAIPFEVRDALENYLTTLPGFQKSELGKQSGKVYEQHGYITMQLTRIFGSLADVYAHILRTQLAEVDFNDVVLNRRILVVLLPALEKSPDELANLGKLIIASLKAMLAGGLGSAIEGDYRDVIETKPTNAKTPFLCVLDEYGYYAVPGFAVVPAQARSLGFSVIFAGQDLPAFQKASKEEAASICANTNVKICMKLEDPQETWEFFQKTAGESYVSMARSFSRQGEGSSAFHYKDTMEATMDKRSRLDLLDLKDQREGEAHIFFRSTIIRASMFFANPPRINQLKVNQMLKVDKPSDETTKVLKTLHSAEIQIEPLEKSKDEALASLFDVLNKPTIGADQHQFTNTVLEYIRGATEEEEIDFGDQTTNPSIFMHVPVDERLSSRFFDVEIATLLPSVLTKEKLYEVVKRMNILQGESEKQAKQESMSIINEIERQTSYRDCMPKRKQTLAQEIRKLIGKGQ